MVRKQLGARLDVAERLDRPGLADEELMPCDCDVLEKDEARVCASCARVGSWTKDMLRKEMRHSHSTGNERELFGKRPVGGQACDIVKFDMCLFFWL